MREAPRGDTFDVGDRVRIDIPDETDPSHRYHGKNGEIISVIPEGPGAANGGSEAGGTYRIELDIGGTVDVGPRDLRPPI